MPTKAEQIILGEYGMEHYEKLKSVMDDYTEKDELLVLQASALFEEMVTIKEAFKAGKKQFEDVDDSVFEELGISREALVMLTSRNYATKSGVIRSHPDDTGMHNKRTAYLNILKNLVISKKIAKEIDIKDKQKDTDENDILEEFAKASKDFDKGRE